MMAISVVVVLIVLAGLGFAGIIKIPGITPAKAKQTAAAGYSDKPDGDKAPPKKDPKPVVDATPKADPPKKAPAPGLPKKDPIQGAVALATVWNELKTPDLAKICADWKDAELVKVLTKMDTGKVAKLLAQISTGDPDSKIKEDPIRASKLSKLLQDQGSVVKEEAPG
jgi:hypothetical protein